MWQRNHPKPHFKIQVYSGISCQVVINQGGDIVDARYRIQECMYKVVGSSDNSIGTEASSTTSPSPSDNGPDLNNNNVETIVEI